jgi:2-polyprenyl-3-methyl-5-hydroxy-6-metoxy-1,4-benzoquinol methylase
MRFPTARILAVDLSLTSLAYATRRSRELGFDRVEYAQADILELGALDRRFDVVESIGVLHHLGDPIRGWRVLTDLLKPGGMMFIGLYSELARKAVVAARAFIAPCHSRHDG